ncbi:Non-repetitive/WGA-negative nucleoporin C-terminal-domain-containing protein [Scheffersomyces xylosifermentans]|uniref:Non-repetitive/WGA-negative nucleoporin C-terminal-domain-containing protein n=1 Tax=Scheffersomyces xylosifermentans TaxID=1304137 RepID=UPI00315D974E
MPSSSGSIFRARKRPNTGNSSTSDDTIGVATDSSNGNNTTRGTINSSKAARELTKNKKYCVSRLPALPSVLENSQPSEVLNAYSDHESNYSLVVNENTINVWSYKSTDPSPLAIQFPIESGNSAPLLPLAILTKPSSGTSQDPGLVIIYSNTGKVKFYESVQHAPALGLINDKSLELTIPINSGRGEYITLAENVEPAGIVVATSWKRCILISLRDFKSKPSLSTIELLNSSGISRLFLLKPKDEIVSIKSGKLTNHGMTQEIIIQDSAGAFNLFTYQLLSANGNPYVEKKLSFKQHLSSYVENSVDGYLPGSSLNIKFLDLWPLLNYDGVYLGLCDINESMKSGGSKNLLLLTLKIDSTGVLLYGSHKLLRYEPDSIESSTNKPKLFLPKPGKTAFITLDNTVIITDIDTSYIENPTTFSYYKPRWEDVIRLKSSVEVIGLGYENQSSNSNPAILIISKNFGVLRVERFPEIESTDDSQDPTDPLLIVKSHIEQGIFYADSTEIEFDIYREVPQSVLIFAMEKVVKEIINSTSPYLPSFLPSTAAFLNQKSKLYQELISYSERNFTSICPKIVPKIVEYLEKVEAAENLWAYVDENHEVKKILESVVKSSDLSLSETGDVLRQYFSKGVESINGVLTDLIVQLASTGYSLTSLTDLIVKVTYNGIYLNEAKYIINHPEYPITKLWIYDTELVVRIDEIFTKEYYHSKGTILTESRSVNLIKLTEVLYYFVTNAIRYMQFYDKESPQLVEYAKWFKERKHQWIDALLKNFLSKEALSIAERYRDFSSVAFVLDTERSKIVDKNSREYNEVTDKYAYFFDEYKYDFASNLYDYYLKNDKIQPLLLDFTNHKAYLNEFLQKGSYKTTTVAWIRYLLDQDFGKASESLVKSATHSKHDNLDNKELKYSLAKLSAIATKGTNKANTKLIDELLSQSENSLVSIRCQSKLRESLLRDFHGEAKVLNFDLAVNSYTNPSVDFGTKTKLLEDSFKALIDNKQLSSLELINWLTLIKPSVLGNNGFVYALKVAAVETNERKYQYFAQLIWLRLITVADDWSILNKDNLGSSTDIQVQDRIRKTVLFHTLKEISLDSRLVSQLRSLIIEKGFDDEEEDDIDVKEFNEQLLAQLDSLREGYDFEDWLQSIEQDVKNNLV